VRQEEILRSKAAPGNRRQQAYLHLTLGAQQFAQGDFGAAASSLRQSLTLQDSVLGHMLLAEALAASQHWQEAAGEYELFASRRGQLFDNTYLLVPYRLADYDRGRAYQALGDAGRARSAYAQFLRVVGDNSSDWIVVRDARKRLRALGAAPLAH
jgi:tetratricopeptide (TPR) repeat protein